MNANINQSGTKTGHKLMLFLQYRLVKKTVKQNIFYNFQATGVNDYYQTYMIYAEHW